MLHLVSDSIYRDHGVFFQGFFPDIVYELLYLPFPLHMPSELSLPATKSTCRTAPCYRLKALKTQMCFLEPILSHSFKSQDTKPHFTVDHSEMAAIKEHAISLITISFLAKPLYSQQLLWQAVKQSPGLPCQSQACVTLVLS